MLPRLLSLVLPVCFIFPSFSFAYPPQTATADSETLKQDAPKVFMDCSRCDTTYIHTEVNFVNYVRDRKDAQVYVMITTRSTGSSGTEYTLEFTGQQEFEGTDNTLKYITGNQDTSDEIREGLAGILKIGLAPYAGKTPIADRITVTYTDADTVETDSVQDKWDYWVFSLYGRAGFDGQKTSRSSSFNGSFSANRVTEAFKFRISYSGSRSTDRYSYGDIKQTNTRKSHSLSTLAVKSISDHWSIGAGSSIYSNTYSNLKFRFNLAPAIEYNIFPYSESTRRQLRFLWKPGYGAYYYHEETIYDKTEEKLWSEEFSAAFEIKEKWGTVSTGFDFFHYFHDLKKNRMSIDGDLSIRLFKGLSFSIYGYFQRIRDQLSLRKGEVSEADLLLRRIQLETNYSYYGQIGLNYTFGSIYSNVVNPRFYGY
jgi:hypothetical protein